MESLENHAVSTRLSSRGESQIHASVASGFVIEFIGDDGNTHSIHDELASYAFAKSFTDLMNYPKVTCRMRHVQLQKLKNGRLVCTVAQKAESTELAPERQAQIERWESEMAGENEPASSYSSESIGESSGYVEGTWQILLVRQNFSEVLVMESNLISDEAMHLVGDWSAPDCEPGSFVIAWPASKPLPDWISDRLT